jgi:histidyl-tRNA synthetase
MIQAPKGTHDIFGDEMIIWRSVENIILTLTQKYNYKEIRTPIIESTELFLRGVGDTTDIVQKEMYTFDDKGGRSLTLRPELTAGVARAYVEHGMHNQPQPTKLWYIGPNFRYEAPQSGRYRQHYQFGVEVFGSQSYASEAEIISLGWELLAKLGVKDVSIHINSIGCNDCRKVFHTRLKEFLSSNIESLCGLCKTRYEKNPLRTLDCKNLSCKELLNDAPSVLNSLDDECMTHFEGLQKLLNHFKIPYTVDSKVVRGLDYYTRTVFEFIHNGLTVIGGGRYDGLIGEVGGNDTPGVGFGMGIERLVALLKKQGLIAPQTSMANDPVMFIGHLGEEGFIKAQELSYELRKAGIPTETDLLNRSVKAQMKYANKIRCLFTAIIGSSEIESGKITVKFMNPEAPPPETQIEKEKTIPIDRLVEYIASGGKNEEENNE